MDRHLKQYDKEFMKMALLKHEETFKQQVHELHRLYRVQKILMNDMKAELKRQRQSSHSQTEFERWNEENENASHQSYYNCQDQRRACRSTTLDLELPAEEYIGKNDEHENNLELTLATGGSRRRKKEEKSFTNSDSGASFSSSSTESSGMKLNGNEWGLFQVPNINLGSYQIEKKIDFDGEERLREERVKQPPWLFQCLSLNMT